MPDYQNGKIYKIISSQTNLVYVGSTTQELCMRMGAHRRNYKTWSVNKKIYISSFELMKYDDCKIILIEKFPCNDRSELVKREQEYIEKTNCVNKSRAFRTEEERKAYNSKYNKIYNIKNKELISNRDKIYYNENKEKILQTGREKYILNKDIIQKRHEEYYKNNKEKLNKIRSEKIHCECGSVIRRDSKSKHLKSIKHQTFINQL